MLEPLALTVTAGEKKDHYERLLARVAALIDGERDEIAILSTVCCELHGAFSYFHWTGFYRVTAPGLLKVGPYQGGHGCLTIPFSQGVCGRAATLEKTQRIDDVSQLAHHIACSATTRSEMVVPIVAAHGRLVAVLDVDSDELAAFDEVDQAGLERVADLLKTVLQGG
jgi:GAF domain-containing protein